MVVTTDLVTVDQVAVQIVQLHVPLAHVLPGREKIRCEANGERVTEIQFPRKMDELILR